MNEQGDFGFEQSYSFFNIYINVKKEIQAKYPKMEDEPMEEYREFIEYEVFYRLVDILKEKCENYGKIKL